MCNAVAVGLGIQGVGTLMKASAQRQQGEAAREAAIQSADASERAAADALDRGRLRDLQEAMKGGAVAGAQVVAQSGSGVDLNVGGSRTVRAASEAVSQADRAIVRRNAALEAYGLLSRARIQRQQGEYALAEGKNAALGTFLSGIGGLVGEGGKVAADMTFLTDAQRQSSAVTMGGHLPGYLATDEQGI